jgi:hypothetical protein
MDDVLAYIKAKLDDRRRELETFLGKGTVKDHAEYMKVCGTIQGLGFVAEILEDLADRLETSDE